MKTIKLVISKDGSEIKTDADGFKGTECLQKAENLLSGLASEPDVVKKDAFFEEAHVTL